MGACASITKSTQPSKRCHKHKTQLVKLTRQTKDDDGNLYKSVKLVPLEEAEANIRGSCKQLELVRKFLRSDVIDLNLSPSEVKDLTVLFKLNAREGVLSFEAFSKLVATEEDGFDGGGISEGVGDTKIAAQNSQRDLLQRQLFEGLIGDDQRATDGIILTEFLKGFSFWKSNLATAKDAFVFFFQMFDTDQSGAMSHDEFRKMVRHVLISQTYNSEEEEVDEGPQTNPGTDRKASFNSPAGMQRQLVTDFASLVYKDFDKDGSGEIDFDEFSMWVKSNPTAPVVITLNRKNIGLGLLKAKPNTSS